LLRRASYALRCRSFSSVANPHGAVIPFVTVPIAAVLPVAADRRRGRLIVVGRSAIIGGRGRGAVGDGAADDRAADQAGSEADAKAVMRLRGRHGERARDRCDREGGSKGLLHFLFTPGGRRGLAARFSRELFTLG